LLHMVTPQCPKVKKRPKDINFGVRDSGHPIFRKKPYHISTLYVVDLERFRRELVGDQLRAVYQQSAINIRSKQFIQPRPSLSELYSTPNQNIFFAGARASVQRKRRPPPKQLICVTIHSIKSRRYQSRREPSSESCTMKVG
jgi:hypothetical protein